MTDLTILRKYALTKKPTTLPPTILFESTDTSITLFDAYPKALFHFLILPRLPKDPLSNRDLTSLRTLLKCDREVAKEVLVSLGEDSKRLRVSIEEEMVKRYGFKWDIWVGFHAVPSMEHLHLHVISSDLTSRSLKHKKHYNSFHPKLGFFLHLEDVLSWFDSKLSHFTQISRLEKSQYEHLLKEQLRCYHCQEDFKTIPKLKEHLENEWRYEGEQKKAQESHTTKRKRDAEGPEENVEDSAKDEKRVTPAGK